MNLTNQAANYCSLKKLPVHQSVALSKLEPTFDSRTGTSLRRMRKGTKRTCRQRYHSEAFLYTARMPEQSDIKLTKWPLKCRGNTLFLFLAVLFHLTCVYSLDMKKVCVGQFKQIFFYNPAYSHEPINVSGDHGCWYMS